MAEMRPIPWGRLAFAGTLLTNWVFLVFPPLAVGLPYAHGLAAHWNLSFLASPLSTYTMSALLIIALLFFVRRRGEAWAGAGVIALMVLAYYIRSCQLPDDTGVGHSTFMPVAALIAYLIAQSLADHRQLPRPQAYGQEAACGIVATGYGLAGFSKLQGAGLAWAQGSNLSYQIAVHSYTGAPYLRPLRLWAAQRLGLCAVLGGLTLFIECSFFLFAWAPARKIYCALTIAMHAGIALLMGFNEFPFLFTALSVGLLQL